MALTVVIAENLESVLVTGTKTAPKLKIQVFWDFCFYIHGSVHRDSLLIRSNKMHRYAGIYLLRVYSTCFGRPSHPSSGVQKL